MATIIKHGSRVHAGLRTEPYIEIARRSVDIATAMRVLAGAEDGPQHRRFADALATIWN